MAIDLRTEAIYNLRAIAKKLPRPVSTRTLKRWINEGLPSRKTKKRIKLECIRHGHEICISFEAYERFVQKLGGD